MKNKRRNKLNSIGSFHTFHHKPCMFLFSIKSRVVVQCRIVSCDGFYENRYNNVASKIACIFTLNFQMQTKRLLNIFLIKLNDGVIPSKIVSLVPMMRLQALVFYLQIQHHILTRRDTQFFLRSKWKCYATRQSQPLTMYIKHQIWVKFWTNEIQFWGRSFPACHITPD